MDYLDVIREFDKASCNRGLTDDYLQQNKFNTREDAPLAPECEYGIIYLRDDGVEILIQRIKELEEANVMTKKKGE